MPPSVAFISDIFHPLVAPLTTYTYSAGSSGSETVSATDNERLSPGGFSLRHRFPQWFNRSRTSDDLSGTTSRNTSNSYTGTNQQLRDALRPPSKDNFSRESSAVGFSPPRAHSGVILEILQYIKKCFDDESALDTLPLEAAGNLGAWKAWQAYRRTTASATDNVTSTTSETQQDEWSWDGVWEQRVRKGIDNSVAESTLYGGASGGADDQVCLQKLICSGCIDLYMTDPFRQRRRRNYPRCQSQNVTIGKHFAIGSFHQRLGLRCHRMLYFERFRV